MVLWLPPDAVGLVTESANSADAGYAVGSPSQRSPPPIETPVTISPLTVGLFWLAVILGITAGFFVLVRKLAERREAAGKSANQMLAQFRSLRDRGGLSEEEFQHIRTKLGPQVQLEAADAVEASTMADATAAMRDAAAALAGGWNDDSDNRTDNNDHNAEANRAAGEDCDTPPPDGGDSTEADR